MGVSSSRNRLWLITSGFRASPVRPATVPVRLSRRAVSSARCAITYISCGGRLPATPLFSLPPLASPYIHTQRSVAWRTTPLVLAVGVVVAWIRSAARWTLPRYSSFVAFRTLRASCQLGWSSLRYVSGAERAQLEVTCLKPLQLLSLDLVLALIGTCHLMKKRPVVLAYTVP